MCAGLQHEEHTWPCKNSASEKWSKSMEMWRRWESKVGK